MNRMLITFTLLFAFGCLEETMDPRPGPGDAPDAEIFDVRVPLNSPSSGSGSHSGYSGTGSGAGYMSSNALTVSSLDVDWSNNEVDGGVLDDASVPSEFDNID